MWWNNVFLTLMSQRWNLKNVRKVLDVGCGIGHWGHAIAPFLGNNFPLYGLDAEKEWIMKANERAKSLTKLRGSFNYLFGKAESIPFEDNFFDMVTCQTLPIHVSNPMDVIHEMTRVLKPKGIIIAAEPNNVTNSLIFNSTYYKLPVHDILDLTIGEGNNSLRDLVPGLFASAKLSDIEVYLSDKTLPLFPPYQDSEQRIMKKQLEEEAKSNFWNGKKEELRRYFMAFDPDAHEFDRLWTKVVKYHHYILQDIELAEFHAGGSSIMYLVSGRKPAKNDEA
ncbi:MAG: methyltransferase domain-containing protein [Candidatus Paracaedimonas acanthamoebae]|uniref:Methyltransferase domain-containing protein n=1 Tax=Candidatus Paracaedimonas acanthamoebae TaxID=244581 RepID=A0A8J7Q0Y6_9PROT|nr:methyltransferase domain-containing protein [Candidatus Paracaedimonas acanthamoebae]